MKTFLLAPLALLAAGPLAAQATPANDGLTPVTKVDFTKHVDDVFGRIDTNKDGALSVAEIAAAEVKDKAAIEAQLAVRRKQAFDQLDTDKNGQISFAEFAAGMPKPNIPTDGRGMLNNLDTNKDGKVSLLEYRAPQLAKFNQVDVNKDGTATIDEQRRAAGGR